MATSLSTTTPSDGLQRRLRPDEEVKWVVEKDMKTSVLGAVAAAVPLTFFFAFFGLFVGIFVGTSMGFVLGFLAFLVVTLGPGALSIGFAVANAKVGGVEYAATSDRFVKVADTITGSDEESVPINRVRDAEYDEDFADKIFGTGDIKIEGTRGDTLNFDNAPNADALLSAVREEIARTDTVTGGGHAQQQQPAQGYQQPAGNQQGQPHQQPQHGQSHQQSQQGQPRQQNPQGQPRQQQTEHGQTHQQNQQHQHQQNPQGQHQGQPRQQGNRNQGHGQGNQGRRSGETAREAAHRDPGEDQPGFDDEHDEKRD